MSVKASNWAWEQDLPPASKLVLMALADSANESGECWPRIKTIAKMSCVSERTVRRVIQALEKNLFLASIPRFTESGRQTSNRYRLALDRYPAKLSGSPLTRQGEADTVVLPALPQPCQGEGDKAVSALEPLLDPSIEPSQEQHQRHALQPGAHFRSDLDSRTSGSKADMEGGQELVIADIFPVALHPAVREVLRDCPAEFRQSVLDEVAGASAKAPVHRPLPYLRKVVQVARAGRFTPSAGVEIAHVRARAMTRSIESIENVDGARNPAVRVAELAKIKALIGSPTRRAKQTTREGRSLTS